MSATSNSLYGRIHKPSRASPPMMEVSSNSMAASKPLNFNEAMEDFRTMFPHIDPEVIETVLRSNDGIVQVTIDQLLQISEGITEEPQKEKWEDPSENQLRLPCYTECLRTSNLEEPPPAYSEIDRRTHSYTQENNTGTRSVFEIPERRDNAVLNCRTSVSSSMKPVLVGSLPDDFLRLSCSESNIASAAPITGTNDGRQSINGRKSSDGNFYSDNQIEQFIEDEKLAMFLQNEEFIRELRRNPDFLMSLEEDHREFITNQDIAEPNDSTTGTAATPPAMGGVRPKITGSQEDVVFRQKLKHMGKTTRRKLGKLAKRFSRKKGGKAPLHGDSTTNLLEEETGYDHHEGIDSLSTVNEETEGRSVTSPVSDKSPHEGRYRNPRMTARQLPPIPTTNNSTRDEPIVFYSEDNEFAFKTDH